MPPSGESTILEFRDVCLYFGETPALDHVSFSMSGGDSRIVYGVAGSGKTTLLKVALGLVKPDSGRVFVFGQDATDLKEGDWFHLRARMGILFQEGGLFDSMNIAENVAYPLVNQPALRERLGQNGQVDQRVREALRFVELEHTLEKFPASILVTHRFQDGHLMADFRYNPDSGQIETAPQSAAHRGDEDRQVKTKFFVMNSGRLVFAGTRDELRASEDPYVRKFAK
jgi:phospholipid/cholesterol/gamma-HCH transport system ATP-binding protein